MRMLTEISPGTMLARDLLIVQRQRLAVQREHLQWMRMAVTLSLLFGLAALLRE